MCDCNRRKLPLTLLVFLVSAIWVCAEDWPQWRGLLRDGHSGETGLLKQWPEEGPKLLWQVDNLGSGYSTPSVSDGRIFLMSNEGLEDEFVIALDVKDGSRLWSTRIGKVGNPEQNPNYPAARSTPTVDGKVLYVLGSDGDLVCLECNTGKVRWQKSLRNDFGGMAPTWAFSESPLVDGDMLVCMPGGTDSTIVALAKRNGKVIWESAVPGGGMAGYSSLIIANIGNIKQYIAYLANGLAGVEAGTGKFLWSYEKTKGALGMSIQTPVFRDGYIYTGASRVGGGAVKLSVSQGTVRAEEVYFDPKLPTAIGGTVLVGDYLYGSGQTTLMCVEFETGRIVWNVRSIAPASLCYVDGLLFLHGEDGEVALIEASPEAYTELGRFMPPDRPAPANQMEKSWAYPVIANGRLYIRDKNMLWCYDIKDGK